MKKTHYILIAFVGILSLSSCASYSNKITRDQTKKLTKENIQNIEGTYEIECYDSYFKMRSGREIVQYDKPNGGATINRFTNTAAIDSTIVKKLVVDIKLISDTEIKYTYRHEDTIIEETILGMKIRKNGMLHLKNRETEIMGVPLIFGNIQITKSRIGISKSNDLVIHNLHHITGGAIIIMSDSRNHNTTFYFKRIHASS